MSRWTAKLAAGALVMAWLSGALLHAGQTLSQPAGAPAVASDEVNTGQDITKPVRRLDVRYQYQEVPSVEYPQPLGRGEIQRIVQDAYRDGVRRGDSLETIKRDALHRLKQASLKEFDPEMHTVTFRMDAPIDFGGGFKFNTRIDLPVSFNDIPTRDNPTGDMDFNLNDVLLQGLVIYAPNQLVAFGAGTQLIVPTGTPDSFSGNRWRLVPTLGGRVSLPMISKGSFFVMAARYDFDLAGDNGRKHTSQLQFSPTLNIALPDRWFLTLYPSTDIRCNLMDNGKWFVPADFLIGKMINKTTVASVEVSIPIVDDFDVYDFKVEARIGFFF